jgi:DNA-binding Xre family transcriptional regulator
MSQPLLPSCTQHLQQLMQRAKIDNFKQLRQKAGISAWQIRQFRQGHVAQMRLDILLKLSQALQVSLQELLAPVMVEDAIAPSQTVQLQNQSAVLKQ